MFLYVSLHIYDTSSSKHQRRCLWAFSVTVKVGSRLVRPCLFLSTTYARQLGDLEETLAKPGQVYKILCLALALAIYLEENRLYECQ
jgi:hypothetical protein